MNQLIQIQGISYTIEQMIGEGSFGKIYRAKHDNINYAIKIQRQSNEKEKEFLQVLLNQGKNTKNLVQVFGIEYINGYQYAVMEFCESSLYDEFLKKKFEKENIRYIMKQIANGIYEMHKLNYTHRDLKPENILVKYLVDNRFPFQNSQKIYKICDFGTIQNSARLQTKNCGTPQYMAPELLNSQNKNYTNKCDIWSLGTLIYEMVTGEILFNGQTEYQVYNLISNCKDEWIQNQLKNLKIDRDYQDLLTFMIKIDPEQRLSIEEVLKRLEPRSRSVSRNKGSTNSQILQNDNKSFTKLSGSTNSQILQNNNASFTKPPGSTNSQILQNNNTSFIKPPIPPQFQQKPFIQNKQIQGP